MTDTTLIILVTILKFIVYIYKSSLPFFFGIMVMAFLTTIIFALRNKDVTCKRLIIHFSFCLFIPVVWRGIIDSEYYHSLHIAPFLYRLWHNFFPDKIILSVGDAENTPSIYMQLASLSHSINFKVQRLQHLFPQFEASWDRTEEARISGNMTDHGYYAAIATDKRGEIARGVNEIEGLVRQRSLLVRPLLDRPFLRGRSHLSQYLGLKEEDAGTLSIARTYATHPIWNVN